MREIPRIEVVLAVVQRNGRICLVRRSDRVATSRGMWSVVTGYVEPGVDPLTQVCQELDEELGLRSPDARLVHSLPPVPLTSAASGKQFLGLAIVLLLGSLPLAFAWGGP